MLVSEYDRVNIKPAPEYRTDENCTGVYMGTSNITDGSSTLVGIGKKSMDQCRFVIFAVCLTADDTKDTNIAEYAVENNADASIGWAVYVSSTGIQNWEGFFFSYLDGEYEIVYNKEINGFKTPYSVIVFVSGDEVGAYFAEDYTYYL